MRRTLHVVLFLGVLACGLLLYWQHIKREPKQSREAPSADMLAAVPLRPPRLAPAVPSRDAGNNAGPLVGGKEPLIQRLHVLEGTNPALAESLALEDRQRFPNSPDAEERDMVLVAALHNKRDLGGARREAWYYFMHYPQGRFTEYLSRLTGLAPPLVRPNR